MKILYAANIRFPTNRAHGIQIIKMCNAFAALGHSVMLAVTNRSTNITETAEQYYGEKFQFIISAIPVIDAIAYSSGISIFNKALYLLQRMQFALRLDINEYNILYARDPFILWLLSWRADMSQQMVYESHEAHYNFFVRRLFKKQVKVVAISEGIRDFYLEKGESTAQIHVAHDGIDETFFTETISKDEARKQLGLPLNKKIAMYIGGFDVWKGVDTFFAASEHNQNFHFVAIGGSPDEIRKLQKKYPKVTFLGYKPYRELSQNQRAADVLVIPNTANNHLSAQYTSPLKLFAHLASTVPLVVSNIPSMRNVVSDDEVTFVHPDDPIALSEAILEAESKHQKGKQAYLLAQQYTWQNRARAIVDFINLK